jgi:hypothetical protein
MAMPSLGQYVCHLSSVEPLRHTFEPVEHLKVLAREIPEQPVDYCSRIPHDGRYATLVDDEPMVRQGGSVEQQGLPAAPHHRSLVHV